jgi:Domain of unknown function (DUF4878)
MRRPLATGLLLCGLALGACGGGDDSDREEAERTVRDFVRATSERDAGRFCGDLVAQAYLERSTGAKGDAARQECRRQLREMAAVKLELVRIRDVTIDGDRATVRAVIRAQGENQRQELRLVKEDGDWRLSGRDE